MSNLLRFIKLYHFLLLFVLIESFSIFLLVNNNDFQKYKFFVFAQENISKINNSYALFIDYFKLKETNEQLSKENAKLYSILESSKSSIDDFSFLSSKEYIHQSAQVINNSVYKRNNYLTINKGKIDGVKEGMGIINLNGIVGIVHSVSDNYALIISVLHQKSAISVQLKKQRNTGFLKWGGFNYLQAEIVDIPEHINLEIGDTISSSGYGTIFPKGIDIGTVRSWGTSKKTGSYSIKIKFFQDFNALEFVYIVYSPKSYEQKKLEKKIDG